MIASTTNFGLNTLNLEILHVTGSCHTPNLSVMLYELSNWLYIIQTVGPHGAQAHG